MKKKAKATKAEVVMERIVGGKFSELATYSDLFERTNDAIFLVDLESDAILQSNASAQKIFGIDENSQGKDLFHWVESSSLKLLEQHLRSIKDNTSEEKPFDCIFINDAGTKLTFELSMCRLRLGDYCEVLQVIAKDVTAVRAITQELMSANLRLSNLSNTDEMTKLFNFRYFKNELAKEHERAVRYKTPYAVILCDIDHFKHFNDTNGHLEGDEALKGVAAALQERARKTDIVARYGGEEFLVFCPELTPEAAYKVADSLRSYIASKKFPHGEKQPLGKLTVSIGVACYPAHAANSDEIIRLADTALYHSKENGRNQATIYLPEFKSHKKAA